MRITLDDLHLRRGDFSLRASLVIESGGAVAVIGPSGAGKSTLLNTISGFETPSAGRVLLGGEEMTRAAPAARPVTMLFQDNNLFPHLTVFQNTALGRSPTLRLEPDGRVAVEAVLARVGLEGSGAKRAAELSGGQQSRVALARALLRDRPILLLDEPFAALGPALRQDMLGLVAEIRAERGMTLLMITHDPGDAAAITEQTVFVDGGTVSPPQETAQMLASPTPALAAYLGL